MTHAPVANFYACRISRRAMVASEPTWNGRASAIASTTDVAESLIEHGRTFIKSGEGMALRVAIVIGAGQACAFVTNGAGRSQFFTGKAAGSLILDSVDGSRLVASSRSDVQECWLSRPGTSTAVLSFKAEPSDGCAGLYRVNVGNGGVHGVDGSGNMLRGDIEGVLSDGTLVVHGVVSPPTGASEPFTIFLSPGSHGAQWWIVQRDGRVTGGSTGDAGAGSANWLHAFGSVDASEGRLIARA